MARECSAVHKYGVIAYRAIVSDMCVGHDQVMAADSRDAATLHRATVYRGELAKFVGVPDFQRHTLAFIGQILRIAADNGKGVNVVSAAKPRRSLHHGMVVEDTAVTQLDFHTNYREGADFCATSDPRGGGNVGPRINFAH